MIGQTNLFDDVIKSDERFVIVVQSLEEKNGQLVKNTLREYPSLNHDQMNNLFTHLKEVFLEEKFQANQSAFTITVYTNLDYAADQVYAHVKRYKGKNDYTQQNNLKKDLGNLSLVYIDNMLVNMLSRYHQDT